MTDQNNNDSLVYEEFSVKDHPHLRFNPLIGEYVLVCPNRTKRPWLGFCEKDQKEELPDYDVADPLCPSNTRPCGVKNENYKSTFVFENDYPALIEKKFKENQSEQTELSNDLDKDNFDFFKAIPVRGTCKVICFHPRHNLSLAEMDKTSMMNVINLWINQMNELKDKYEHIQLFETKGEIMGCSNAHPHGQIWANMDFLPNEVHKKNENQLKYYEKHKSRLLTDYLSKELAAKERVILQNNDFVVLVPYFAYWPYEVMILPSKRNIKRINELTEAEKDSLADLLKRLLVKYDNLFECSFPYAFGWHGAPTGKYLNLNTDHWTLHGVFYPPLLRSAKIKKFVASYELFAMPQRDLTPEQAAQKLRSVSEIHYKEMNKSSK